MPTSREPDDRRRRVGMIMLVTPLDSRALLPLSGEKRKAALGTSSTFFSSLVMISAVAVMPGRSFRFRLLTERTAVSATTVPAEVDEGVLDEELVSLVFAPTLTRSIRAGKVLPVKSSQVKVARGRLLTCHTSATSTGTANPN